MTSPQSRKQQSPTSDGGLDSPPAGPRDTDNPFASHHVRPGALPFLFADDQSAASLVARLAAHRWRGQIVGPHGTGKSTLLETLLPELQSRGREVVLLTHRGGRLRRRQASTDAGSGRRFRFSQRTQVVIDGFERLALPARLFWRVLCRLQGAGLLVTAHRRVGLPTLYETRSSPALARQIVARLLREKDASSASITPDDVAGAFERHEGNVRDALFALYDIYERRR